MLNLSLLSCWPSMTRKTSDLPPLDIWLLTLDISPLNCQLSTINCQLSKIVNCQWLFTNIDVYIDEDWRQINHWEPFSFHVNLRQFIRQSSWINTTTEPWMALLFLASPPDLNKILYNFLRSNKTNTAPAPSRAKAPKICVIHVICVTLK